ncbi:MAG: YidC/Oxa1 family membrane protein insertase [Armatimonadota bacterium]|jgi:YidC/Oxa1 family membrane protein insertase|nr:membrane protein insertase YidC [Fimbriimonadaceae bacterium]MCZ8139988.1 membrane protein insertase YidC [Fimbriimonadaceae bacterium]
MARPQARPQGNFLQIALITILLMISYQMLCVSNKPNDPRTRMQVQAELEQQNMNLLDLKIVETERLLIAKIDEELKAGKLTKQEADEARLASVLTVAATQFQTGVAWNHYAKIDRSYTTLAAQYESYRRTPLWKNVDVTVRGRDGAPVAVTAESLYNEITTELSARNKKEIVWGVLPGWQLIDVLVKATGSIPSFSYAFAAFLLALVVRGIIWPLAHKQYQWGRQMAQLSPRIKEIQDKYKDKKTGQVKDPQAFQMETMAIYKQYGINPMAGCWPALIQMPLFLAVYQCMWKYKFEFTKGSFLWVHPGADKFLGIPMGANLGEPDFILIFLYGVSMVVTTLLQPVTDSGQTPPIRIAGKEIPQQRFIGLLIAVVFSVTMFFWPGLPSAFVLYWIFTNILSTVQSLIEYRLPLAELVPVQSVKGGALPGGSPIVDTDSKQNDVSSDFFGSKGNPNNRKRRKK